MGRNMRGDYIEMYKFYFLGMRTGLVTPLDLRDPMTNKICHFNLPQYKKASYRDVAKRFGYSVRQIEKIGAKNKWYLQRKYFPLKVMNKLPWHKEWIYRD